jgi:arylsulfatase A-like enzyme
MRGVRAGILATATLAALSALAVSVSSGAHRAATAQAPAKPNILLIETDDQTLSDMRVLPGVKSLIGDRGVTFDSSFVSYSLCCPSRATVLTGQYAHNHGVLNNTLATGGGYYKLDGSNTLPVWLQRAGYATVHLGKYLNQYGSKNATEVPPGWTEWHGLVDPTTYRYFNYTFNDGGVLHVHGSTPGDYQTDVIGTMAQEIIRRRAASAQPFFMWTAFLAPHAGRPNEPDDPADLETPAPAPRYKNRFASEPLPKPASFNEQDVSDKPLAVRTRSRFGQNMVNQITEMYRQRLETLLAVDDAVAGIMNALQQTGELDNTLVIFTSDNGYMYGQHRIPQGKIVLYEPSIRVPLLMRGPGIPVGAHRSQVVANIDLAPTIVDAAGADAGRTMDGTSLLPLAADGGLQPGRDLLLENGTAGSRLSRYTAVRTLHYLYAQYANGEQEFYDVKHDPDELQSSLTADNRRTRSSLKRRLAKLTACRGSECRHHPTLKLSLSYARGKTDSGASCARGAIKAEVRGKDRKSVTKVGFYVGGHRVVVDGHSPFTKRLGLSRFTVSELTQVRARVTLKYDRLLTLDRNVRRC